jgi:hypothetical protein
VRVSRDTRPFASRGTAPFFPQSLELCFRAASDSYLYQVWRSSQRSAAGGREARAQVAQPANDAHVSFGNHFIRHVSFAIHRFHINKSGNARSSKIEKS